MADATGRPRGSKVPSCPSALRASTSAGSGKGARRSCNRARWTRPATCSRRSTSCARCAARARSITTTRSSRGRSGRAGTWAMSRFIDRIPAFAGMTLLLGVLPAQAGPPFTGIGRAATTAEIAAWDIDVRPDFKGLPPGSGSVAEGQKVWDAKCASCHGTFGESNEVFTPLVGGTTAQDVKTGRVAALTKPDVARTTLMKLSTVSTLWDYVRRAMPWNAPKSLTTNEVYAVVAYLLNLGDILPDDFVLSDRNIAEAQARLPNRNGMTRDHGLWGVKGKPDVANAACMNDCASE